MPIHIEQMNAEVTAVGGEMPWSSEQIAMLVRLVIEQLEAKARIERAVRDEARLQASVLPRRADG
jgi:hypothetical protein